MNRRSPLAAHRTLALALLALGTLAGTLLADEAPLFRPDPALVPFRAPEPAPLRLAEAMSLTPAATLRPAAEAAAPELAAMAAHNALAVSGRVPVQVGFARALSEPLRFAPEPERFAASIGQRYGGGWLGRAATGEWVWGTSVAIPGAGALRLELADVDLPEGTRLWVYGTEGEARPFDLRLLRADRSLVTPTIEGEEIRLEVALPADAAAPARGFRIDRVFEQVADAATLLPMGDSCLHNAECYDSSDFPAIEAARDAVFQYLFISGGFFYTCSGGLLNDTDASTVIYWGLTANHCITSQAEAQTVDAKFFFRRNGCPGTDETWTRALTGWNLTVSSATSDVSLMRPIDPTKIPAGVALLGWSSVRPTQGTVLYRLSHPVREATSHIEPQTYSTHQLDETPSPYCAADAPLTHFLYSLNLGDTGVSGGSSGSPVMNALGQVVGQLSGTCGVNQDGCGTDETVVDGSFSRSFPLLAPYLNPASSGTCVPDADTACLLGGRFKVEVTWTTASSTGPGQIMSFGSERAESNESAFFWFFSPTNFEMGVKMVDACVPPWNRYWVFVSGLTSQQYEVRVTRMANPTDIRTYTNPLDHLPTTAGDTDAFTCP